MDTLKVFENPAFGKISALTIEGEPWFVGRDVASVLGYKDCDQAIRAHVDAEDKLTRDFNGSGQNRKMTVINESGLYSLILSSKLDSAKAFKRWVTAEVLPSIRKNGGYIAGQETLTDTELLAKAVLVANRTIEARDARIRELEAQAAIDAPKVRYADAVAGAENGMLVREFAKILKENGIPNMGEKRLYEDLRRRGLLIRAEGRDKNRPTQYAMERGWFSVREREFTGPMGITITRTTTLITGKGRQRLLDMYLKERDAAPVAGAAT